MTWPLSPSPRMFSAAVARVPGVLRCRQWLALWLLLLALPGLSAAADDHDRGSGIAVAIGGALKLDNDAVWQRLVDLAGGPGARYVVLATAAANPERSAAPIVEALNRRGALAEAIPVAPRLAGSDAFAAARDPALAARVLAAQGVYFAGGAQERITATLLDEAGRPTPVLDAIWQVYRRGGVVAGSSAGAAIMSTTMFRDAQDVLRVLKLGPQGLQDGREIGRGLGFVGPDVFVDQHFLKRGRFGRMLPLMVQKGYRLGVGVDENTAAIFRGDTVEVIGYKGALVADLTDASSDPALPAFNLRNARLTYLDRGDRYDLKTRRTTPSPEKLREPVIDPNAPGFRPYFTRDAFYADVLGDTTVLNLMANLIDNRQAEVIGLAFGAPYFAGTVTTSSASSTSSSSSAPSAPTPSTTPGASSSAIASGGPGAAAVAAPELGFEFRFRKGADSLGYYTGAFGGEDYTVVNILLDVTPVRLSQPLYRPLAVP